MISKREKVEVIAFIVNEVMLCGAARDKLFEQIFRAQTDFTEVDRGFIVSEVNGVIRNWRFLNEIYEHSQIKMALIPTLVTIQMILEGIDLNHHSNVEAINKKRIIHLVNELKDVRAITESVPDWLDERCISELGDRWPALLRSLNQDAETVIRTNTLKIGRADLRQLLLKRGFETEIHGKAPDALILQKKAHIFKLPEFKSGFFEMQDLGSQRITNFADPKPGMRIIDACAGNGGKTLHLAALMQNRGRCISMDIFSSKLETLKQRCKRAGVTNVETRVIDSTKIIKRLYGSADLVLLDVPCSGLGVLKRNPEIKWRLRPEDLQNLLNTQSTILDRYTLMAKPGGCVVYSTCSILPSENQLQVQSFLNRSMGKFELSDELIISPEEGFDGFYMARVKRSS